MKIRIEVNDLSPPSEVRIGNVYSVKGGRGLKEGHMQVLIAITEPKENWQGPAGLLLVIDKQGKPKGVNSYGMHYLEDLCPIAFVEGLEDMELVMRSLS